MIIQWECRFKGLDPIDTVPEELQMKVHDIVQEAEIKTIPKGKNAKRQNGCLRRPYKEEARIHRRTTKKKKIFMSQITNMM